jgi:NAD(P)H-flavin reductase
VALLTLPIRDVRVETPRTRGVLVGLSGASFDFLAGQAVWVGQTGRGLRKPYSIASSPEQARRQDALELLIQVLADGSAGAHLDAPVPGMLVDVDGPMGRFCFPRQPPGTRFLFVAGGTGIAPLRAMLWHALSAFPDRGLALLYSARSADEFAYAGEIRELARGGRIVLRETVTREAGSSWAGERGRISRAHVAANADRRGTVCFVCGPPAMVQDVTAWLRDLDVPAEQIFAERS